MAVATRPVSVVLPVFNEEQAVGAEITKIQQVLQSRGIVHEVLVVDDGSKDRTADRAIAAGARVMRHVENRGYGSAIKTGMSLAQYDTIVITDADGTYPAEEIPVLLDKMETADMVVGARTGSEVHIPLVRRPAKWVLTWVANRAAGRHIPDLNSGLRAFRRDVVSQYLTILSNRFSFTSTVTLALMADDYRVVYHPINYFPRVGRSKIRPWHFMEFVMLVLRLAVMFQPLRVFLPLALVSGALGILKAVYDVFNVAARNGVSIWAVLKLPVLSPTAIFLLLLGLQMLLLALVVDAVIRRIAQNHPLIPSRATVVASPSSVTTSA